jgi:hypothetical protein
MFLTAFESLEVLKAASQCIVLFGDLFPFASLQPTLSKDNTAGDGMPMQRKRNQTLPGNLGH